MALHALRITLYVLLVSFVALIAQNFILTSFHSSYSLSFSLVYVLQGCITLLICLPMTPSTEAQVSTVSCLTICILPPRLSRFRPNRRWVTGDIPVYHAMVPDNVRCFLIPFTFTDCVLHRAHAVHTKYEYRRRYLSSFLFELAGLGLFFVFWIVGAGVATVCSQLPFILN